MLQQEVDHYTKYCLDKYKDKHVEAIDIKVDENDKNYVELSVDFSGMPFERIRRITGYLVGTLDRWNNAKRAEENDRVKHGM